MNNLSNGQQRSSHANGVQGRRLQFDGSGWVAREGDSAADPNNKGGDITNTWKANGAPSDDELADVLRQVDNIHKQAREAIANWFANYQKAKPNAKGVTEGPRTVNTNEKSSHPGSRGDLFSKTPERLQEQLEFMRKWREEEEHKLTLMSRSPKSHPLG